MLMKKILLFILLFLQFSFANAQYHIGVHNGYEWVDLGLPSGTLWATCNVGAYSSHDKGDYFAWGETEPKEAYAESTYKYATYKGGAVNDVSSYDFIDIGENISGTCYDVASAQWGGNWRMPTYEQCLEIYEYCTWEQMSSSSGNIFKVTSKINGDWIFFPIAGFIGGKTLTFGNVGCYWSSDLYSENIAECFMPGTSDNGDMLFTLGRDCGCPVRPVITTALTFEDPIFEKYCIDHFDTNGDGRIQIEEAEAVEKIKCDNLGIVSLSGIENFKNLVVLECYDNNINELYLNNNTLLEGLDCGNNEIYVLDVSGCNRLEHLDCNKNCISELDLATNTNLRYLNCSINRLSKLNLSNNGNLQELRCAYNKLNILDISDNEKLDKLVCHDNPIDFLYMLSTQVLSEFDIPGITTVFYKDTGETGIEKIGDTGTYVSSVYTIDGKPSSLTNKGLNIIRSKDGKPKKVIIK